MKNIPDANESWLGAEQLLDKHFRRKKIITWLFVLLIPAIAGIGGYFYSQSKTNSLTENVSENVGSNGKNNKGKVINSNSEIINNNIDNNNSNTISDNNPYASSNKSDANNISLSNINKTKAAEKKNIITNSSTATQSAFSETATTKNISAPLQTVKKNDHRLKNVLPVTVADQKNISGDYGTDVSFSTANNGDEQNEAFGKIAEKSADNITRNENADALTADRSDMNILFHSYNKLPEKEQYEIINETYADKPFTKKYSRHVSIQVTPYAGINYVYKTLSSNTDGQNFVMVRQDNENNIITPAFGINISAMINKLCFSIGAEYSTYGERTNYQPFSLQQTITENGNWNQFNVTYIDTDTAFVIGNQYLMSSPRVRVDSIFNSNIDTTEQLKYDQSIADHNGANRFSYVEIPIMFSCNILQGRGGVGISAGVSPGWLTSRSGYYLREDGHGVQSVEEIDAFNEFILNARAGFDIYYRMNGRMCLSFRPQFKTKLNSVFKNDYSIKQKYSSVGALFGISWMLN